MQISTRLSFHQKFTVYPFSESDRFDRSITKKKENKSEDLIRHCKQWALVQVSGETETIKRTICPYLG